jgi:acyl-CoA thioesterase-1
MLQLFISVLLFPLLFSPGSLEAKPDETQTSKSKQTILFLGNSLTAGFRLNPDDAFPALIQEKIKALNWPYTVKNAGLSGETSSGGLRRINWLLKQQVDVLVLELGANDGLRGISTELTQKNLQGIIDRVKSKNPEVSIILAGMQVPPNLGPEYASKFREIFPSLAQKNNLPLIPFLLKDVAGNPKLNLPDGIHPTSEGHKIIAETVWKTLEPVLEEKL